MSTIAHVLLMVAIFAIADVLLATGFAKLAAKRRFLTETLVAQPFEWHRWGIAGARAVAIIEVLAGSVCYLGFIPRLVGLSVATLLLACGAAVLADAARRRSLLPCGCAGQAKRGSATTGAALGTGALASLSAVVFLLSLITGASHLSPGYLLLAMGCGLTAVGILALRSGGIPLPGRGRPEVKIGRAPQPDKCNEFKRSPRKVASVVRDSNAWLDLQRYAATRRLSEAEAWHDGCWDFLAVPARHPGRRPVLVFGVHRLGTFPVRGAIVDLDGDAVMVEHSGMRATKSNRRHATFPCSHCAETNAGPEPAQ